jgi:DNA-binding NarL/FixJ family response regulator
VADVVALLDDLFFQAKILETAKHAGVEVRVCATPELLLDALRTATPRLVIVDLNAKSNALEAIGVARSAAAGVPLIAFLSHVQTELAERARTAGCAEVMPRSKLVRELATILGRAKSEL